MLKFIFGLIIGLLLLPVSAYLYVRLGYAPVATNAPPIMFEKRFTRMALHARIEKEAPKEAPIQMTEAKMLDAAHVYADECAFCHGLKDEQKPAAAKGMFPSPPQLLQGKGVTDDPPGETFWKVKNGIRLTGMPSYSGSLTDQQMWEVSVMLANADKLPAAVMPLLTGPLPKK